MLVYAKVPMGYTTVGGKRIYGKNFSYGRFGATEIPYKLFMEHKEQLDDIEYTGAMLEEKFGHKFPEVSFKLSEIHLVIFLDLVEVIRAFGIKYSPSKNPTIQERRALRRSIINRITD